MQSQARRNWTVISLSVSLSLGVAGAGCNSNKRGDISEAATTTPLRMVYLNQGWSPEARELFYRQPQGSQLIPYAWFLALEQVDSEEPFRSDANMEKLGFITQSASARNPEALPIGFVRDVNPPADVNSPATRNAFFGPNYDIEGYPRAKSWLGLTCAACHTSDIQYKDVVIRIDGGPTLADLERFEVEMAAALRATHVEDKKFDRFANLVWKELGVADGSDAEAETLRKSLKAYTGTLDEEIARNKGDHAYGFARLDAFGAIFNKVLAAKRADAAEYLPANAPVSFPFLWDTPHLDWVQWNGSAGSAIERNVGEVLGVFADSQLSDTPRSGQFQSTADLDELKLLEDWLKTLKAPKWPKEDLEMIDAEKARIGQSLYAENCATCHSVRSEPDVDGNPGKFPMTVANDHGHQFIKTRMVTVFPPAKDKIGTDPLMVLNFITRARMGQGEMLGHAVLGVIKLQLKGTPEQIRERVLDLSGNRKDDIEVRIPPPNVAAYKARPLNGIWATAPYLHNGSVPNLYQLLLPAKDRFKRFYVGSRKFDPVNVGFETQEYPGGFEFRTVNNDGDPIPGNANSGHEGKLYTQKKDDDSGEFRDFTDPERWAIVEYMKTLE